VAEGGGLNEDKGNYACTNRTKQTPGKSSEVSSSLVCLLHSMFDIFSAADHLLQQSVKHQTVI
jgi:hypothetical protein